jgi:hypothetical protein
MRAWKLSNVDGEDRVPFGSLERFAADLRSFRAEASSIERVIVAMEDRRGSMPVRELLDLRLKGVVIEDASALMERLVGKLPLDGLNPSSLIFTQGFNVKASQQIVRRLVSITVSFIGLASACRSFRSSSLPCAFLRRDPSFSARRASDCAGVPFQRHQIPDHAPGCRSTGSRMGHQGRSACHYAGQIHAQDSPRRDSTALERPCAEKWDLSVPARSAPNLCSGSPLKSLFTNFGT